MEGAIVFLVLFGLIMFVLGMGNADDSKSFRWIGGSCVVVGLGMLAIKIYVGG